tara:strand:+ start:3798 stop:4985 length:1188 start_codon:yes stop_codon:yes gene_type:complete
MIFIRFKNYYFFLILTLFIFSGCSFEKKYSKLDIDNLLETRYDKLLKYSVDSLSFPRSYSRHENASKLVPSKDWTSGFFAGNLWYLYTLTGNQAYIDKAQAWTSFIEKEKFNDKTHDMGFKIYNSFGNGLKIKDNKRYKNIIVKSAKTLSTRFNENIKSIRSWDFNKKVWQFPVIIDNMMNLELLFEATKLTNDSTYHNLAVTHANTTLKHHFRPDNSCYHVIDYDTITYQPRMKVTHQGINDESSWARGHGWGIYGYTLAYRYTKDNRYLDRAITTADYFIHHKNMPDDGIPYWDFDDISIPDAPRDVSAGTIVASALVEIYEFTKNKKYLDYSKKVINTLKSTDYILEPDFEAPFILDHSTGNLPKNDEIDEPIVYGDYYFLETLIRLKNIKK